jgi:hypothetical protein
MDFPDEILRHIYDYNLNISIPNKMIHNYVLEKQSLFAMKLQKWYKKNKIDSQMPILFISDFTENPNKFQKWYILRLFMKFYPREDLRDYPKYLIRSVYGNNGMTLEQQVGKEKVEKWKNMYSNWDVLKFIHSFDLQKIVDTGW